MRQSIGHSTHRIEYRDIWSRYIDYDGIHYFVSLRSPARLSAALVLSNGCNCRLPQCAA